MNKYEVEPVPASVAGLVPKWVIVDNDLPYPYNLLEEFDDLEEARKACHRMNEEECGR